MAEGADLPVVKSLAEADRVALVCLAAVEGAPVAVASSHAPGFGGARALAIGCCEAAAWVRVKDSSAQDSAKAASWSGFLVCVVAVDMALVMAGCGLPCLFSCRPALPADANHSFLAYQHVRITEDAMYISRVSHRPQRSSASIHLTLT